jgi:hypothetical protein
METVIIQANAEPVTTFHSFSDWVNKAFSRTAGFKRDEQLIWLDKNNNTLTIGKDFQVANDNDLFPVRVFRLIRTSQVNK